MRPVDPGGGSPSWTGTIIVDPGALEASAPGFESAGDGITEAMASTVYPFADPTGIGITDPGAGSAWARLTAVWTGDLNNLADGYGDMAGRLPAGGASYAQTDASVQMTVHGTSITEG